MKVNVKRNKILRVTWIGNSSWYYWNAWNNHCHAVCYAGKRKFPNLFPIEDTGLYCWLLGNNKQINKETNKQKQLKLHVHILNYHISQTQSVGAIIILDSKPVQLQSYACDLFSMLASAWRIWRKTQSTITDRYSR